MRYAGWLRGYGEWVSVDGDGNAGAMDGSVGGMLGGLDIVSGNAMFGVATGYSTASTEVDSRDAEADTDAFLLAVYGAYRISQVKLSAGASYGWSSTDSKRVALGDVYRASYDGSTANLFAEIAYEATMGGFGLEPFAGLSYTNVDQDGFTEDGGIAALSSDGESFDSFSSTLGLRAAYDLALAGGTRVTPRGSVAWRHAYGDLTPDAVMSFVETHELHGGGPADRGERARARCRRRVRARARRDVRRRLHRPVRRRGHLQCRQGDRPRRVLRRRLRGPKDRSR